MRKKAIRIIIEVVLFITIIVGFVLVNDQINESNKKSFLPIQDNNKFAYEIEEIGFDGDDYIVKGWFFQLEKVRNIETEINGTGEIGLILYDINLSENTEGKNYEVRRGIDFTVERRNRYDINEYYNCEYDYSHCGFIARTNKANIDLNGNYQVVIKPVVDGEEGILTNAYIIKGSLYYTNPNDIVALDVVGTELETIIQKGICLGGNKDYHSFTYQYDNKLYWIIDKEKYLDDGGIYVRYRVDTTQDDKLPKDLIDSDHYYVDYKVNIKADDISDKGEYGRYRVFVKDIPKDFAISYITEYYYINGNWKWQIGFRPILFSKEY